jgi:S-adenosyl methyltransferase
MPVSANRNHKPRPVRFFAGRELVDPGLVQVHQWRPGPADSAPEGTVSAHGAVARKPGA